MKERERHFNFEENWDENYSGENEVENVPYCLPELGIEIYDETLAELCRQYENGFLARALTLIRIRLKGEDNIIEIESNEEGEDPHQFTAAEMKSGIETCLHARKNDICDRIGPAGEEFVENIERKAIHTLLDK